MCERRAMSRLLAIPNHFLKMILLMQNMGLMYVTDNLKELQNILRLLFSVWSKIFHCTVPTYMLYSILGFCGQLSTAVLS